MRYTYDIYPQIGILLIRSEGVRWTADDILESAAEVVSDERMDPGLDWVYDLRSVRETVIGMEGVERILDRFSTYRAEGRVRAAVRPSLSGRERTICTSRPPSTTIALTVPKTCSRS